LADFASPLYTSTNDRAHSFRVYPPGERRDVEEDWLPAEIRSWSPSLSGW